MTLRARLGLLYGGLTAAVVLVVAGLTLLTHASGHGETTFHVLAGASVGGVVLALGAGWLLAGQALRPVSVLTETAQTIAHSRDFERRVPLSGDHGELGLLAATFNDMLTSLEEAYEAERRFVSDASHELRAPLTAIQGNLHLLEHVPDMPDAERRGAIAEASREAARLAQLVADLLALARADAGAQVRREPVELDRVVLEAFGAARHLARGQQLSVEQIEPLLLQGDRDRLTQLLILLLDNAVKYTPSGGAVSVALRREGAWALVTVRDTGAGIPAADLPRVFERFYRADPARARDPGGTGLGLAIGKWIVEQHGGRITLESTLGSGTAAHVRLPLAAPTDRAEAGRRAG
jgi:two-component system OmpR family sensor kinase